MDEKQRLIELRKNDDFQKFLDDMHVRAFKKTNEGMVMYRDAMYWMYGNQDTGDRKPDWEYTVFNTLLPDIEQQIAIVASDEPRVEALPAEDTDIESAQSISKVINAKWSMPNDLNMKVRGVQALLDGHLGGWYVGYWRWNPRKRWDKKGQRWQGDIDFEVINPAFCGFDPDVELGFDLPTKSKMFVMDFYIDIVEAIEMFPEYKDYLEEECDQEFKEYWTPGTGSSGTTTARGSLIAEPVNAEMTEWQSKQKPELKKGLMASRLADMLAANTRHLPGGVKGATEIARSGGENKIGRKVNFQFFLYYQNDETETVPDETRKYDTKEIRAGDAGDYRYDDASGKYYDFSRPRTDSRTSAQIGYHPWDENKEIPKKTIRESYERPKFPRGRYSIRINGKCIAEDGPWIYANWPFAVAPLAILPHCWRGRNSVESAMHMQDYLNKLHTHIYAAVKHHSDPQWIVEEDSLADEMDDPAQASVIIPNHSGAVIVMKSGKKEGIKREEPANMPAWIFQVESIIRSQLKDFGLQDPAKGKGSDKQQTFRGLAMLDSRSKLRSHLQKINYHMWLLQIAHGIAELVQVHYEQDRWMRILGPSQSSKLESMKWTSELKDIRYDLNMVITSTLPFEEQEEQNRYAKATELLGPAMFPELLSKLKIERSEEIIERHQLLGPLTQLQEIAAQKEIPPEMLFQAVAAQLETYKTLYQAQEAPAGEQVDVQS